MSENTDPISPNGSNQTPKPQQAPGFAEGDEKSEKNPYDLKNSDVRADISERIDKCLKADAFSRIFFESNWSRNIFFYAGAQWLRKNGGRWERRNLPAWFPRSMTNKFAEKANDLITQLLQGGRVPISYTPSSDDAADTATADVGESLRSVIYTEAKADELAQYVAPWTRSSVSALASNRPRPKNSPLQKRELIAMTRRMTRK